MNPTNELNEFVTTSLTSCINDEYETPQDGDYLNRQWRLAHNVAFFDFGGAHRLGTYRARQWRLWLISTRQLGRIDMLVLEISTSREHPEVDSGK